MSKVIDFSQAKSRLRPEKGPSKQILLFVPTGKQRPKGLPQNFPLTNYMSPDDCDRVVEDMRKQRIQLKKWQMTKFSLVFSGLFLFITSWIGCTGYYLGRFPVG